MQDKGISETLMPKLMIAGAPTPAGLIAIVGGVLLFVAVAKMLSDSTENELAGDVLMEITWTDTTGVDHNGKIWISLDDSSAPMHAKSFRENVNSKRYDGVIFHRVIDDFMIQGGCPEGTGTGSGPHGNITGEFTSDPQFSHQRGVLSMARSADPNSASCQFFVCHGAADFLDGQYAAFGKVVEGEQAMDAVAGVATGGGGEGSTPQEKCTIQKMTVRSRG